jgi:hypothetical protein
METRLALADSVVVDLHAERMRLVGDARAVMEALLAQSHRCKQTKITLSIAAKLSLGSLAYIQLAKIAPSQSALRCPTKHWQQARANLSHRT